MDDKDREKDLVEELEIDELETAESSPKPTFRDSLYPKIKLSIKQINIIITVIIILILVFIIVGVATAR